MSLLSRFHDARERNEVGGMQHKVYDDTYRDIYDERDRKRAPRRKISSKVPLYLIAGFVFVLVFGVLYYLVPSPIRIVKDIFLASDPKYHPVPFKMYIHNFYFGHSRLKGLIFMVIYALISSGVTGVAYFALYRNWVAQNSRNDNSRLNTWRGDSRLVQPEELPQKFDIFPDVGMHSKTVQVTTVLSHMMLDNAGLKSMPIVNRQKNLLPVMNADGTLSVSSEKPIDNQFSQKLFDSSQIPHDKKLRKLYHPNKLLYNPDKKIGRTGEKTVADKINNDWYMPDYELQRPGGMYIVDTQPNNTMVIAKTRAGKGQMQIEPTIDCWLRSDEKANIVVNDPKGELYLKFYYAARRRGYDVQALNLMNESKTDIYNPLDYAVEATRQDDNTKVEQYVRDIGDIFFPIKGSEDPMWPNAANAAFQRSALGLIDYYKEEDAEMRYQAVREHWPLSVLTQRLDVLWGHVTPYNVYQMMVQLSDKRSSNRQVIHVPQDNDEFYPLLTNEKGTKKRSQDGSEEWIEYDSKESKDYLTLFFDATAALPQNVLRSSVANQDQSLRGMAVSDKTIGSVYGIALTAIKFFTDGKVAHLTSGRPSQNLDITGMAFPRRIEIRFDESYASFHSLAGQKYVWNVFSDSNFEKQLDPKTFDYSNVVDVHGWVNYVTKGIFPKRHVYMRLKVIEMATNLPIKIFYFRFTKGYQRSLNGRFYVTDAVTHKKVIKDGVLEEGRRQAIRDINGHVVKGQPKKFVLGNSVFIKNIYSLQDEDYKEDGTPTIKRQKRRVISQVEVHYTEQPKALFFVTPPHLLSYAKISLIALNQLFNIQVGKSYLTLPSQKPFYKTNYMLDEVGNLRSQGKGIPELQTKESIGLGQSQRFTLILQTLQQLKDVYGDSVDKILQGNTGNIIYLKSTDDSLLSVLQSISGIKHNAYTDSKTVTWDPKKVINSVDSKVSETTSVKEMPVIKKNDMLLIPYANSIVFGHGYPIWNRNQLSMPFAYALLKNQLHDLHAKEKLTLNTIPSNNNTMDFDLLGNQPNFIKMVQKRVEQARLVPKMMYRYRKVHGKNGHMLSDDDMAKLNQDEVAKEIMYEVNKELRKKHETVKNNIKKSNAIKNNTSSSLSHNIQAMAAMSDESDDEVDADLEAAFNDYQENTDFTQSRAEEDNKEKFAKAGVYAGGKVSKYDVIQGNVDDEIVKAIYELRSAIKGNGDAVLHMDEDNNIVSADGTLFVKNNSQDEQELEEKLNTQEIAGQRPDSGDATSMYEIQPAFREYLAGLDSWGNILQGRFEREFEHVYALNSEVNA